MQLTTFNTKNIPNARKQTANIGVNQKSGTLRINGAAVERMKLKENMQVQFHHDDESKGDWYLEIVKQDGFLLRKKSVAGEHGLVTQSCAQVRKIFESIDFEGISGQILIAAEPVKDGDNKLWPLITSSLATN